MRRDKRQIQTAVLGSANSEEPLVLPLEAIELDAFRSFHEHDSFWCGLLLGGCGGQLTTKLYTDRVCHFAHHPGPDGQPHICGRQARSVNSADHLYVKSEAAAWLRNRGARADFEFTQLGGAPIGSVVDIQLEHKTLRVHLDQEVAPEWDAGHEPVLGVSVPVGQDTLIDRWYVHRIRLDSEGTARRVRIGTEAFARPTEWFVLDDCEITDRGLTTPAVERIVQARTTRPRSWSPGRTKREPDVNVRARDLLKRLGEARWAGAAVAVQRLGRELAGLSGVNRESQELMIVALREARAWLDEQAEVRRNLFAQLDQAVTDQEHGRISSLMVRVNATAAHNRTVEEDAIAERAADCIADLSRAMQEEIKERFLAESAAADASTRVGNILRNLQRGEYKILRPQVETLVRFAETASKRLTRSQARQIEAWKQKAGLTPADSTAPDDDGTRQMKHKRPLHRQVARRYWIKWHCPRCTAAPGKDCTIADGTGTGGLRYVPHDERLQPILDQREARQRSAARSRRSAR
ncbi:hypothetical protein [Streptomyces durocortorensis]|uniref:DNA-binding phage zinc finger domain-containing protein n=1 Tax=Streptomyces durocortorensis TaxID=2811104 RepID=A0ABS2HX00_9ACTN|nr:hypothetical protein [Streptomyces durocortorensis]MBM7054293.1 hypothetical protein [Streptomyces durocortorensis]